MFLLPKLPLFPVPFIFRRVFPCSPEINDIIIPLFPITPAEGLTILRRFPGLVVTLPNVILCNGTKTMTSATDDVNIRNVTSVVCAFRRNVCKIMNKNDR